MQNTHVFSFLRLSAQRFERPYKHHWQVLALYSYTNSFASLFALAYYASDNTSLEDEAYKVTERDGYKKFVSRIADIDWDNWFVTPHSGLVPLRLTYMRLMIWMDAFPLRDCHCSYSNIPEYFKNNRYIVWYTENDVVQHRKKECQGLCVFRLKEKTPKFSFNVFT